MASPSARNRAAKRSRRRSLPPLFPRCRWWIAHSLCRARSNLHADRSNHESSSAVRSTRSSRRNCTWRRTAKPDQAHRPWTCTGNDGVFACFDCHRGGEIRSRQPSIRQCKRAQEVCGCLACNTLCTSISPKAFTLRILKPEDRPFSCCIPRSKCQYYVNIPERDEDMTHSVQITPSSSARIKYHQRALEGSIRTEGQTRPLQVASSEQDGDVKSKHNPQDRREETPPNKLETRKPAAPTTGELVRSSVPVAATPADICSAMITSDCEAVKSSHSHKTRGQRLAALSFELYLESLNPSLKDLHGVFVKSGISDATQFCMLMDLTFGERELLLKHNMGISIYDYHRVRSALEGLSIRLLNS